MIIRELLIGKSNLHHISLYTQYICIYVYIIQYDPLVNLEKTMETSPFFHRFFGHQTPPMASTRAAPRTDGRSASPVTRWYFLEETHHGDFEKMRGWQIPWENHRSGSEVTKNWNLMWASDRLFFSWNYGDLTSPNVEIEAIRWFVNRDFSPKMKIEPTEHGLGEW